LTNENELPPEAWFEILRRDYLDGYIPQGGGTVKVVVAPPQDVPRIRTTFERFAKNRNFEYAHVDAATRKLHMMQGLYNEIARQLPWDDLARRFMAGEIERDGRTLPADGQLTIDALAEANDEAKAPILHDLRRILSNKVYKDYSLSREFRAGAFALCKAAYDTSPDVQQEAADVREWLRGDIARMSLLRKMGIYRKISRTNARQILFSTTSWLKAAGSSGLIVTLDMTRYTLGKDAPPDGNIYTKAAAMDMNEVLRQFIDSADDLTSAMFVFFTTERFLQSEDRGLRSYEALRLRLTDDVRDRHRPNPFAPMVRLRYSA
jgi:hypothetical protein